MAEKNERREFEVGFQVIVGARDAYDAVKFLSWPEAVARAEAKTDGLNLTSERALLLTAEDHEAGIRGYYSYRVPEGHFAIRETKTVSFGNLATLWLQNW